MASFAGYVDIPVDMVQQRVRALVFIPTMKPKSQSSAVHQTRGSEYLSRFLVGGLVTAVVGLIAKRYGLVVGGLFLAFPSIFPASATLIARHEQRRRDRKGADGEERGRKAVAQDALGAAMGTLGLVVFAVVVWHFIQTFPTWIVLMVAMVGWWLVSFLMWEFWEVFKPQE